MQVRALSNVLELAATYPVARQCFIALGARDRIAALSLEAVVHVKVAAIDEYGQWPVENSRKLGDAVKTLSLLRARCVIALGENDVHDLWRAFFLAGDEYEREKTVLRLLTFFSNKDFAFLAARALTSILRRPIGPGRRDLPETTWSQLFLTLSRLLLHERDRPNTSHRAGPYRTRIDPGALDVLIRSALERASVYFGQFSLSFTDEESPLMTVVYALHGQESSHLHYPDATEFASMLVSPKSRQRMRHASA